MEHFDDHEGGQGEGGGHAGDADRGQGALGGMPLEQWYFDVPIVTRTFGTVVFLTSLACVRVGLRIMRMEGVESTLIFEYLFRNWI